MVHGTGRGTGFGGPGAGDGRAVTPIFCQGWMGSQRRVKSVCATFAEERALDRKSRLVLRWCGRDACQRVRIGRKGCSGMRVLVGRTGWMLRVCMLAAALRVCSLKAREDVDLCYGVGPDGPRGANHSRVWKSDRSDASLRGPTCHVRSCHVSCRVMSSRVKSRRSTSCHVMSCHVMSCQVRSSQVRSGHVTSRRINRTV